MIKHLKIKVYGRVVDVNYRSFIQTAAETLGLTGFAKNAARDLVYIEVEGEEAGLVEFLAACRRGNSWSEVKSLDVSEGQLKNFTKFEKIYGQPG